MVDIRFCVNEMRKEQEHFQIFKKAPNSARIFRSAERKGTAGTIVYPSRCFSHSHPQENHRKGPVGLHDTFAIK